MDVLEAAGHQGRAAAVLLYGGPTDPADPGFQPDDAYDHTDPSDQCDRSGDEAAQAHQSAGTRDCDDDVDRAAFHPDPAG